MAMRRAGGQALAAARAPPKSAKEKGRQSDRWPSNRAKVYLLPVGSQGRPSRFPMVGLNALAAMIRCPKAEAEPMSSSRSLRGCQD